jgi:hypothetical protein
VSLSNEIHRKRNNGSRAIVKQNRADYKAYQLTKKAPDLSEAFLISNG